MNASAAAPRMPLARNAGSSLVKLAPALSPFSQGLLLAHFNAQLDDLVREHIAHVRVQLEHHLATSTV
jgi:hypothetical protein